MDKLRETMWAMNAVDYSTHPEATTIDTTDEDGNPTTTEITEEEGAITTSFDMRVQNEIDRFHLVKDVLLHLPRLGNRGAYLIQQMNDKLVAHKNYIHEIGQDMPEILDWKWHLPENK